MRLIDADELKRRIEFVIRDTKELLTSSFVRKTMLIVVDQMPTIDPKPKRESRRMLPCKCDLPGQSRYTPDNGFCFESEPKGRKKAEKDEDEKDAR